LADPITGLKRNSAEIQQISHSMFDSEIEDIRKGGFERYQLEGSNAEQ